MRVTAGSAITVAVTSSEIRAQAVSRSGRIEDRAAESRQIAGSFNNTKHATTASTLPNLRSDRRVPEEHRLRALAETPSFSAESTDCERATGAHGAIVLIDPRVLFRDCLAYCLQQAYSHRKVIAYGSVAEWMATLPPHDLPAIVLLSVPSARKLSTENLSEAPLLTRIGATAPVVIVSDSDDPTRILAALKNGARGYIPTSLALAVAVEAVRLVDAGGTFVPVSTLLASRRPTPDCGNVLFTPRQIMVMEALHRGKANKQIAIELNMRESTVKVHIRHIMKKLRARNRTEVAVLTSELFEASGQPG